MGFSVLFLAFSGSLTHFHKDFSQLNTSLIRTINNNDIQLRSVMDMRVAIGQRAALLWHMTLTEDFFVLDELLGQLYEQETNYQKSRIVLLNSELDVAEKKLIHQLDTKINQQAAELKYFTDALIGKTNRDFTHKLNHVLSNHTAVINLLDNLIEQQQQQNIAIRKSSTTHMKDLLSEMIATIVVIVVFGTLFAIYVICHSLKQSYTLQATNRELAHVVGHDSLTGLPNRSLLLEQLTLILSSTKRKKEHAAVLFVDLNDFKPINDNYGHNVGGFLPAKGCRGHVIRPKGS